MLSKVTYVPGACNIGVAERRSRRNSGLAGVAVTLAAFAGLLAVHAAPAWHLALFLPAAGAAISLLQSALHFCVGFGMRGLFNFGALGETQDVADAEAVRRDRRRSWQLIGYAGAIGLAVAVAATGLAAAMS